MSFMDEEKLRQEICSVCDMLYQRGLIVGPSGNVSARLDEERILLTPGGLMKFGMKPDQMIIVDMSGNVLAPQTEANRGLKPSSELAMHLEVYRQRQDVGGVVHAHPSMVVALSDVGIPLRTTLLTEGMLFLGPVPTASYATPTTVELAQSISQLITEHDAVVLPYHGVIVAGHDVLNAFMKTEVIEQVAQIQVTVHRLGGERPLPRHHVEKMLELRKKYKHQLPGDEKLLRDYQ